MIGARYHSVVALLLAAGLAAGEIANKGWWKHMVFYQIYPRSFMDSDGDGVGDLKGITSKLDHFVESGIGAIWLSPINTSPMVDFGYDISDFKDVDSIFGSLTDFKELINEAHKRKLKVILDFVPNHTSDKHNWFTQSVAGVGRYSDFYIWADGKDKDNKTPPNNWISVFSGPAWTYSEQRKKWYFHQFEYRQPDLNYSNPIVQTEMLQVLEYWLDQGVDGFRIDAVPHIFEEDISKDEPLSGAKGATNRDYTYLNHIYTKDHPQTYELIQSWKNFVNDYATRHNQEEKLIMTEAYTSLANTTRFYKYGADVPFNFNFIMNVNASSKADEFKKIIVDWMANVPEGGVGNWVMGNHDRRRTATRYPGRADQMTMLAMILPGVAVTYNGEEIGMVDKSDISWEATQDPQACNAGKDKYQSQSRDPNRTPFQWDTTTSAGFSKSSKTWLPVHDNYPTLNLAKQKADSESHYKVYTSLTALRKSSYALKEGELETIVKNGTVLIVARKAANESVTLLINFSDVDRQTVNLSNEIVGKATVKVASVGSGIKTSTELKADSITIPPKASMVIYATAAGGVIRSSFTLLLIALSTLLFKSYA